MTCISHLESTADGSTLAAGELHNVHAGKPLLVRYDLDAVRASVTPRQWAERPGGMWRYEELLPLRDQANRVSLGEAETPLLHCPRLGERLGIDDLWIKDESRLPGGSFKARGMAMAVSMAKELGVSSVATPTAGNAGGALAAYAARAGMSCYVFMPDDTPVVNRYEAVMHGAKSWLVDGLIHQCGAIVREHQPAMGWFDMSTLREPYRIEGKKTMGLELAEQCSYELPDVILYPTGGGTGLIGMWKAFGELAELGWLKSEKRPRMFSCQSDTCAPLVPAFEQGLEHGVELENPETKAAGIRVPKALGDFLVLRAVRESGGRAMAAAEEGIRSWMELALELEGVPLCPESAACIGVLAKALKEGHIGAKEKVVLFNTGAAQKYVEVMACELPRIKPADWQPGMA